MTCAFFWSGVRRELEGSWYHPRADPKTVIWMQANNERKALEARERKWKSEQGEGGELHDRRCCVYLRLNLSGYIWDIGWMASQNCPTEGWGLFSKDYSRCINSLAKRKPSHRVVMPAEGLCCPHTLQRPMTRRHGWGSSSICWSQLKKLSTWLKINREIL